MEQWQMEIDFTLSKKAYRDGTLSLEDFAESVAKLLTASLPKAKKIDEEMAQDLEYNVIPLFEEIAEATDIVYTVNDFDNALEALYDWADTRLDDDLIGGKRMCWIVP